MATITTIGRIDPPRADAGAGNPLDDRHYTAGVGRGFPSLAGTVVSAEGAMRISAVYRAVSILANLLAWLPKSVNEYVGDGRRQAPEHPLDFIISVRPNEQQSAYEFWRLMMTWLLLRSIAFAQIVVDGTDLQLIPLHPDRMSDPERLADGAVRYWYSPLGVGRAKVPLIDGQDVWVLRGMTDDGVRGLSMLNLGRETLGTAIAAQQHAASFYANGVNLAGTLDHPGRLKPETAKSMSENFQTYFGGRGGFGGVPVLWEGMKFNSLSMTNKDAELIESLKYFSVTEVARYFGIPPHLLADTEKSTSWGSGIEEQRSDMTTYTVLPWCALIETSLRKDLLLDPRRYYVKFNVNALLRGKTKERYDVYAIGIQQGVLSPNDARKAEDLEPREGGDVYVTPTAPQQAGNSGGFGHPPANKDEEDQRAADARTEAATVRARGLARWAAGLLVQQEEEGVRAVITGTKPDKWKHGLQSFYGRHAAAVAAALGVSVETAKGWCSDRQAALVSGGLPAEGGPWRADGVDGLVTLAGLATAAKGD